MPTEPIISHHRLPAPYRWLLIALWLAPVGLLLAAIIAGSGMSLALFDPRFLLIIGLMAIPAFHVWQQGVDVLHGGLIIRIYWPRYYAYEELHRWQLDEHVQGRVLTIWHKRQHLVLAYHAAHLNDLPLLLNALQSNIGELTSRGFCQSSVESRSCQQLRAASAGGGRDAANEQFRAQESCDKPSRR
jgi:hypothetical protein